jgi:PhnB protein
MEPAIYLFSNGNCRGAMTHYAEALGGTIYGVFRNADSPDAESRMPGGDDLVMNMAM